MRYNAVCTADKERSGWLRTTEDVPICSHSAPPLIILLHSAVSCPKSEARTEGEMIALGIVVCGCGWWSIVGKIKKKLECASVCEVLLAEAQLTVNLPRSRWWKVDRGNMRLTL